MDWVDGLRQVQAQDAISDNVGLRNRVGNYAGALSRANANIDYAQSIIDDLGAQVVTLNRAVELRTQEAHDFRLKLVVEMAHSAGLNAYVEAFAKCHPDSPVLADSGHRYQDGSIKSCGRTLYEEDFDTIITNHNIERPEQYRAD